jgi:hypothetical protein
MAFKKVETKMGDEIQERLADEIAAGSRHNTDADQPMPPDTIRQVGPSPAQDAYSMEDAYAGETREELGSVEMTGEETDPQIANSGGA